MANLALVCIHLGDLVPQERAIGRMCGRAKQRLCNHTDVEKKAKHPLTCINQCYKCSDREAKKGGE